MAKKEYSSVKTNGFVKLDEVGSPAKLMVGDIVTNKIGHKMVIDEINDENETFVPSYSIKPIGEFPNYYKSGDWGQGKYAWWDMSEFGEIIELGPAHKYNKGHE